MFVTRGIAFHVGVALATKKNIIFESVDMYLYLAFPNKKY